MASANFLNPNSCTNSCEEPINLWKESKQNIVYKEFNILESIIKIPGFASKIGQFGLLINSAEFMTLTHDLFDAVLHDTSILDKVKKSLYYGDYPGFKEFLKMAREFNFVINIDWIKDEIKTYLYKSLDFACIFKRDWCSWVDGLIRDPQEASDIHDFFIEHVQSLYTTDINLFIRSLKFCGMNVICNLMNYYSNEKSFSYDQWRWLADLLYKSLKKDHQIMIPQIVPLVVGVSSHDNTFFFNEERNNLFFKDRLREIMKSLTKKIDLSEYNSEEISRIEYAGQKAKEWLLQHKSD